MSVVVDQIVTWLGAGTPVTVATVVDVEGSAPQPAGAMLAVAADGDLTGTIGGGCLDSTLVELALQTEASGDAARPPRLESFSAADGPGSVGPLCGGRLSVLVEELDGRDLARWISLRDALRDHRPVTRITTLSGAAAPEPLLLLGPGASGEQQAPTTAVHDAVTRTVRRLAVDARRHRRPVAATVRSPDLVLAVQLWPQPYRLIIVGADAVAVELSRLAVALDLEVIVCDPRPLFTRPRRFPAQVRVITGWPQHHLTAEAAAGRLGPDTGVCILGHDERTEIPTLLAALSAPRLGYLGALGSTAGHRDRRRRLLTAGADPVRVDTIRSPVGLDLADRTPAGVALSIVAEITAQQHGGTARSLSATDVRLAGVEQRRDLG